MGHRKCTVVAVLVALAVLGVGALGGAAAAYTGTGSVHESASAISSHASSTSLRAAKTPKKHRPHHGGKKHGDKKHGGKKTVTYAGSGRTVHLSTVDQGLRATSASFRKFVKSQLRSACRAVGCLPECRQDPVVEVKIWSPAGFAKISNVGWRDTTCSGGGYFAIYVKTGKRWSAPTVLAGQESLQCSDLLAYGVPQAFAFDYCYTAGGVEPVLYAPGTPVFGGEYDTGLLVSSINGGLPAGRWATTSVVDQMVRAKNDAGVWESRDCFLPGDPEYTGTVEGGLIGSAALACVVTVDYYDNGPPPTNRPTYAESWVMQMAQQPTGDWQAQSMQFSGGT